jgi:hypothetical protein
MDTTQSNYIVDRRLEQRIRRRAAALSLGGDPIDPAPPVAATLDEQLASLAMWLDLPADLRRRPEAWQMVRGAVSGQRRRAHR